MHVAMGLIREALRAPKLDQSPEAEACVVRLLDGTAIPVEVPYETVCRLVFGHRPLAGPPRGFKLDEKRGWLELGPPACIEEDRGVIPLTAITAITPLFAEDLESDDGLVLDDEELKPASTNGSGNGLESERPRF
jgi:hypothetical protein